MKHSDLFIFDAPVRSVRLDKSDMNHDEIYYADYSPHIIAFRLFLFALIEKYAFSINIYIEKS